MIFRRKYRYKKYNKVSINELRFTNKVLAIYSLLLTISTIGLAYLYMDKNNQDTIEINGYHEQIANIEEERDYYLNDAATLAQAGADLLDIVTKLEEHRDLVIADNNQLLQELEEYKHREELYDKYGYALYLANGERNDLTYEQLDTLEEMIEGTSIPSLDMILAIGMYESHFNTLATNPKSNARGFGQFLDGTSRSVWKNLLGNDPDEWYPEIAYDPDVNLQMMVAYVDYLIKKHNGPRGAMQQYSGGGGEAYINALNIFLRKSETGSFAKLEEMYLANR